MDLTTNNTPTHFIFPVLKTAAILECMAELEIDLSKAELTQPQRHKDKVRKLFLELLDVCCGLGEEDFDIRNNPRTLEKLSQLQYKGLHDGISEIQFFRSLKKLLHTCGFHDFSWKDLQAPTPKRLRWQLSAIINMAKFREEQLKLYSELNEPRAVLLENLDQVSTENAELSAQLEKVEIESEVKLQEMDEVAKNCREFEIEIANAGRIQKSKREEADQLKRKVKDIQDELTTAEWALQEAEAEEERLSSEVVPSPVRKKLELEEKRKILANEQLACENIEKENQDFEAMCLTVEVATKELQTSMMKATDIQKEAKTYNVVLQEIQNVSNAIEKNEKETKQVVQQITESERQLNRTEEKTINLRKQGKLKIDAANEAYEIAKEQLLILEKDRLDALARVEAGEAEVLALEATIDEERLKTREEVLSLITEYKETEKIVLTRIEECMQIIEDAK